jgi:hypothetical protein
MRKIRGVGFTPSELDDLQEAARALRKARDKAWARNDINAAALCQRLGSQIARRAWLPGQHGHGMFDRKPDQTPIQA